MTIKSNNVINTNSQNFYLQEYGKYIFSRGSLGANKEIKWLVKNFIPAGSYGNSYGASGSFKTFFAIDIGCSIATGKDWLNNSVEKGAVVYIAAEGVNGVAKRIKAWEITNNLNADNVFVLGQSVFLSKKSEQDALITSIKEIEIKHNVKIKLIIIDTLARCFEGDENTSRDMSEFIAGCDTVRAATHSSIMCVHHTGKDASKGARGSSVLRAACDYEFHVKRKGQSQSVTIHNTKQKDGAEMPPIELEMQSIDLGIISEDGTPITSLVRGQAFISQKPSSQPVKNPILETLNKVFDGKATREQLRNELYPNVKMSDAQRKSYSRSLKFLIEQQLICLEQTSQKPANTDIIKVIH